MMKTQLIKAASLAAALMGLAVTGNAQAQEVYGGAGLFGVQIGYAHAMSSQLTLRGDYMTVGNYNKTTNESGTQYQANLKLNRTALLADWFPMSASNFRLTGGQRSTTWPST